MAIVYYLKGHSEPYLYKGSLASWKSKLAKGMENVSKWYVESQWLKIKPNKR